jgi:hypothetical protein
MSNKKTDLPIWLSFAAAISGVAGLFITVHQTYFKSVTDTPNLPTFLPITKSNISPKLPVEIPDIVSSQPKHQSIDLSHSFYFIDYSAFPDIDSANKELKILNAKKYDRAGIFWIPDYPNLSGKKLFEVYADRFNDRRSCAESIRYYRSQKPEAYCAFASKNKNDNPDRFYSDPK